MSQSKFPLIEKYLPKVGIYTEITQDIILAKDLEAELARATVVYGEKESAKEKGDCKYIDSAKNEFDTHQGLLIGYQPIEKEKPVSKSEVVKELLRLLATIGVDFDDTHELIKRIEKTEVIK